MQDPYGGRWHQILTGLLGVPETAIDAGWIDAPCCGTPAGDCRGLAIRSWEGKLSFACSNCGGPDGKGGIFPSRIDFAAKVLRVSRAEARSRIDAFLGIRAVRPEPPTTLSATHRAKLRQSALTDAQIDALGWSSLHSGRLLIPYVTPGGSAQTCHNGTPFTRERRSSAELRDQPKAGKYVSPVGEGNRLYHSRLAIARGDYRKRLDDIRTTLRFTEGELKAESANAHDPKRLTIALPGVWGWVDRYDGQARTEPSKPVVELTEIPLQGREVRLCFDSDLHKPQVRAALQRFAEYLNDAGARVLIEILPNDLNDDRLGIDDLIHCYGAESFLRITELAEPAFIVKGRGDNARQVFNLLDEPADTHGRAVYLTALMGHAWAADSSARDRWLRWTGSHWADVVGDDEVLQEIERFYDAQRWRKARELGNVRGLLAAFRRHCRSRGTPSDMDGLLPFRNGCLRLSDRALLPHDPQRGNTWALPYNYNPGATCSGIVDFLHDRIGDEASIAVFRACARVLLTGERVKAFLEIVGPGDSGKSILANLLCALAGSENARSGNLHRLEDSHQRFETVKFKDKRLAIFPEAEKYSGPLDTLKAMTGGDPIDAEIKGSHRQVDFTFRGLVLLVGNGPIRPSDASGAVMNRRRSIHIDRVVATLQQRCLLDSDGHGGWVGELVPELPGLVNWALGMSAAEARAALARDVPSLARAEAELRTLLETDNLARWAEDYLIWDEKAVTGVGTGVTGRNSDPDAFLYPSYLRFMAEQGPGARPVGINRFKVALVGILRDSLGLPMPAGDTSRGAYKHRIEGSLIPMVRLRSPLDCDGPGVVHYGFMSRVGRDGCGPMRDDPEKAENPAGERRDDCDDLFQLTHMEKQGEGKNAHIGRYPEKAVTAVTPCAARDLSENQPSRTPSQPSRPGPIPPPLIASEFVGEVGTWVSAARDALLDRGLEADTDAVWGLLQAWPAPAISKPQVRGALERLHERLDGQQGLL